MATVTSQLTRIHDAEGVLTTANLPGGGSGATANTDIFLQGAQSLGRRQTTTGATPAGFVLVDAADNDVSAADAHVGVWIWITHYAILQTLAISFATGTGVPTTYDQHTVPLDAYSKLGGWLRIWIDVSRTPETVGSTGLNEAQLRSYGVLCSFTSAPGGNAANLILDAADHVVGSALLLTGTTGLWQDFATADENSTNQYGVLRTIGGVRNCFARVQLGSASSLVFNDSSFVIVFPDQTLVGPTFMGITINLQHASTNIDWADGVVRSVGTTNKGDLVVTGTSGAFDAVRMLLSNLRVVTLTSVCGLLDSTIVGCGAVTAPGSDLRGCIISGSTVAADASALVWDANVDPTGRLDNMAISKGTAAHHAIAFGTTSPTTMTLQDVAFSGFNAANGQNDSTFHVLRTTGTVTINLIGCSGNLTYKSAGATVVLVNDPVTITVTVVGEDNLPIQNAQVAVYVGGSAILNTDTNASGVVSTSYSGSTPADAIWKVRKSSAGATKYIAASGPASIETGTGMNVRVVLRPDINA